MDSIRKKNIVIVGGGPSAMILACMLDPSQYITKIIEKEKTIGRKFLVAGKGGFNLTHSEDIEKMILKYDAPPSIINALQKFTNNDLIHWLEKLGISTYVGSSKRVFPSKEIKPVEVLDAITKELKDRDVDILTAHRWNGAFIKDGKLNLNHADSIKEYDADILIFSMGGASWKKTGSDGQWLSYFKEAGIACKKFKPSNCALKVQWPNNMLPHIGKSVKNISLTFDKQCLKGEMMLTKDGIEGSPAYALSYPIGQALSDKSNPEIHIDLKPAFSSSRIENILSNSTPPNSKKIKEKLKLSSAALALLKCYSTKDEYTDPKRITQLIKSLPIPIVGLADIDEAISTTGGISRDAIDSDFQLQAKKNHYAIGEMLDWNAPTGGYLLQACFSMGASVAEHLNAIH